MFRFPHSVPVSSLWAQTELETTVCLGVLWGCVSGPVPVGKGQNLSAARCAITGVRVQHQGVQRVKGFLLGIFLRFST